MIKRITKLVFWTISTILVFLLLFGTAIQALGNRQDLKKYQPIGQLVEVKGKNMHIYVGGTGDRTVVLASGWGTPNPYADFYPLYDKLGQFAKYVVYDRLGYGFSDQTEEIRDLDSMVEEIRTGLQAGGLQPPYILVGHSLASLEVVRYAQQYPEEVEGVLLIDGGTPEFYAGEPPLTLISSVQRFLITTGVARTLFSFEGAANMINSDRNALKLLPDVIKQLDRRATLLLGNNGTITDELRQSQKNAQVVTRGTKPLTIPLTALSQDDSGDWAKSQKTWTEWSTNGKQVTVRGTRHYIHHYEPEMVVEEIVKLMQ